MTTETLSDKRLELWNIFLNSSMSVREAMETIEEQDREFIKKLKSQSRYIDCGKCGHQSYGKFIFEEDIDELAGEKLTGDEK